MSHLGPNRPEPYSSSLARPLPSTGLPFSTCPRCWAPQGTAHAPFSHCTLPGQPRPLLRLSFQVQPVSGAPGVPGCLPSDISGCPIGILCSVCTHLNPAYSPSSQFFRLTPPSLPKPRDLALWKLPAAPPAGSTLRLSPSCSVAQETDLYTPHLLPLLTYSFWLSSANGRHQQESKVGVFTLFPLSLLA